MTDDANDQPSAGFHPEEMKATWGLRVGKLVTIQASARCTPAGVITAGIVASAVLLAVSVLVRANRS